MTEEWPITRMDSLMVEGTVVDLRPRIGRPIISHSCWVHVAPWLFRLRNILTIFIYRCCWCLSTHNSCALGENLNKFFVSCHISISTLAEVTKYNFSLFKIPSWKWQRVILHWHKKIQADKVIGTEGWPLDSNSEGNIAYLKEPSDQRYAIWDGIQNWEVKFDESSMSYKMSFSKGRERHWTGGFGKGIRDWEDIGIFHQNEQQGVVGEIQRQLTLKRPRTHGYTRALESSTLRSCAVRRIISMYEDTVEFIPEERRYAWRSALPQRRKGYDGPLLCEDFPLDPHLHSLIDHGIWNCNLYTDQEQNTLLESQFVVPKKQHIFYLTFVIMQFTVYKTFLVR